MKILSIFLFVFSQSLSATDLARYTVIPGITDKGKTIEFDSTFSFDKEKKTASYKKDNLEAYYKWGSYKPEEEDASYIVEIVLEKDKGKLKDAIVQTASKYSNDNTLRSATRCFPINSGEKEISLDCVTASAQSCKNLLAKLDQKTKEGFYAVGLSAEQQKEEVNKCSSLLQNYADLAVAYALTTNDNARNAVVNSDMKRISDALETASINSKWPFSSKPVEVLNNSKPKELYDKVASNLKGAPRHLGAIHHAISLCQENKYMFRSSPTGSRKKGVSGTP